MLKSILPEYERLLKSEQIAIQILASYSIFVSPALNRIQKQRIEKLLEVAKLRKLIIPEEWFLVDISIDDVILRIEEFRLEEISWIEEHNYLFDLIDYDVDSKSDSLSSNQSSEEAIADVYKKYDRIIEEQKANVKSRK